MDENEVVEFIKPTDARQYLLITSLSLALSNKTSIKKPAVHNNNNNNNNKYKRDSLNEYIAHFFLFLSNILSSCKDYFTYIIDVIN